ncbi:phage tail assembly chaperone [Methylobacterium sp. JK268]
MPPAGAHLWRWFWDLSAQRTGSGFGPNPLQFSEICAWQALAGVRMKTWERRSILKMDETFLVEQGRRIETGAKDEEALGPNLTPEMMDKAFG